MVLRSRNYPRVLTAVAVVVVGALIGCYPSVNKYDARVSGTVTVGGELAPGGVVTFHPTAGGPAAIGHIHKDGSYSLRTGQGKLNQADGGTVASGEYLVTVVVSPPTLRDVSDVPVAESETEITPALGDARVNTGGPQPSAPRISAAKYRSKETSDLRRTVKPGDSIIVLELERAAVDEVGVLVEDAEEPAGVVEKSVEKSVEETTEEPAEPSEEAASTPAVEGSP